MAAEALDVSPLPVHRGVEASQRVPLCLCRQGQRKRRGRDSRPPRMQSLLHAAIARGVPLYNAGDAAGCCRLYADAARALLRAPGSEVTELSSAALEEALASLGADAAAGAWALRRAFDDALADAAFSPRTEAPLPRGFPPPSPVGRVVEKEYPAFRAARAQGGRAFGPLFGHISRASIPMSAPVLSQLGGPDGASRVDMAFVYPSPSVPIPAGAQGVDGVEVVDAPSQRVLSVGVRGDAGTRLALARRVLEARLALGDVQPVGEWRTCSYNGPMMPRELAYWELQVPIRDRV